MAFDVNEIRKDFPVLEQKIHQYPLVYFDNGATTQKPLRVIETVDRLYRKQNSSIHRGVHYLSEQMTEEYEHARGEVQSFINAQHPYEIIFTSGTTSSINGLAFSFGEKYLSEGDEILITEMEHHANIVPWQMLCERKNARLKVLPFQDNGELYIKQLNELISERTKLIALTHVSNILATINPVKEITRMAHEKGVPVLLDGAQAIQHQKVDVQELDCDFYVFSGHKLYGPTGIGILYGKEKWLEDLPPFQGGGEMVDRVSFDKTTFQGLPLKFEAGTPNYIGAIGMAEAIRYLNNTGLDQIAQYEHELMEYGKEKLQAIDGLTLYGHAPERISIFSFLIKGLHQYDAGMVIDKLGIAVRTGTHCGQTVMQHYGIEGTIRASLVFYNTKEEIDSFIKALLKAKQMFS